MTTGKIVKWVENKGFGFLRVEGVRSDVFVHTSAFGRIPRSPKVGEQVEILEWKEDRGKRKVTQAKIAGLTPLPSRREFKRKTQSKVRTLVLIALLLVAAIFLGYSQWKAHSTITHTSDAPATPASLPIQSAPNKESQFRCEGKTHCSEMKSKAEAQFYVHNCPNTELDGDKDGDACEQQFGP